MHGRLDRKSVGGFAELALRCAQPADSPAIWAIIQQAIEQRRRDGSDQWQDGYPNADTIDRDIQRGYGQVLLRDGHIVAYAAVIFDRDPAYDTIEGHWLTTGEYVNIHRVAVASAAKGSGMAKSLLRLVEGLVVGRGVHSIKIDTNFDNGPMLAVLDKLGYSYCGEVLMRGAYRKAFEKVLVGL